MRAELQPDLILAELQRHGVGCVVIGGMAAYLQGSPLPTKDVDVVPAADAANLARLADTLRALDARLRTAHEDQRPFAHDATSLAAATSWNLTTTFGDLDISLTPSGTQGSADLRRDAVEVVLRGTPVLPASLADVIRSKEAAGRDEDRRALPVLRELLAQQLRARRP